MTTQGRELLRMQLIRHEGLKLFPYRDSVGRLTIGVGRNLDAVGVSAIEAYQLLDNDLDRTISALVARFAGWFLNLDPPRQAAITNVAFNIGVGGFTGFTQTIAALEANRFDDAADQLLHSRWAEQVGARAREIAEQLRSNAWAPPARR